MHPSGNGSGQAEKEKAGGLAAREASAANLGSRALAGQASSAAAANGQDVK